MRNILIISAVVLLIACGSGNLKKNTNQTEDTTQTTEQVRQHLVVNGSCDMCKDRIEKTANSIDGVSSAYWDSETQ